MLTTKNDSDTYKRTKVFFESGGEKCRGYLYYPAQRKAQVPCIVMANGFSGTMDWILPDFAERFVLRGVAVLIFDYRYLGESEGKPRQLISVKKQRADLRQAVAFAKKQKDIDPDKIVLWGTSLGGSHVIDMAAHDATIALVIANAPAIDAIKGANVSGKVKKLKADQAQLVWTTLKLLGAALVDTLRGWLGLSPHYIAVFGEAGRAFFTDPSLADKFTTVERNSPTWKNKVTPRFLFGAPRYREGTMARIKVPIFISLATEDVEVSAAYVKEKAKQSPFVEIKEYPVEHFDLYHGETFNQLIDDQINFLERNIQRGISH